jgi:hypothetical protein
MRFSLLFILALAGCDQSVCTRNSDCKRGLVCGEENTCVVPPDMTKLPDGGDTDGSTDLSVAADLSVQDLAESEPLDGSSVD